MHIKCLLVMLLIILLSCNKEDKTFFEFSVSDPSEIQTIRLIYGGDTVHLSRKNNDWLWNNERYVRPNAMDNLLESIHRIDLKYIPPKDAQDVMRNNIEENGIAVEIWDKHQNSLQHYILGGSTPDERGTFAVRALDAAPVVVHMPGWEGNIRTRYWMKDVDWWDRTVIDLESTEILEIGLEYPRQKSLSFILTKDKNSYSIRPYYDINQPNPPTLFVQDLAQFYMNAFEDLQAEYIIEDIMGLPNFEQRTPFCNLYITNNDGEKETYSFFPQYEITETEVALNQAVGRYYVLDDTGNAYTVQHRVFKRIFRPYNFFYDLD